MEKRNATQMAAIAGVKPPALDLIEGKTTPQFAQALIDNKHWMDGVRYLAYLIPARECVWWAWFCARKALKPEDPPEFSQALSKVEAWIGQPTDQARLAAREFADRVPAGSPPMLLLQAVYFAGEGIHDATGERTPQVQYLTNSLASASIIGSVFVIDGAVPDPVAADFFKQGMEVANRIQLWGHYS